MISHDLFPVFLRSVKRNKISNANRQQFYIVLSLRQNKLVISGVKTEMAHHQHAEFGDQATKGNVQEKLVRQLIDVLSGNREALCRVTEIFQELIEMQHTPEAQDVTAETLETAR